MILTTTPTVIYTAEKNEKVTLNFWNLRQAESTYYLNGEDVTLANCGEKTDDFYYVRVIKLTEGETIELNSLDENSIEVEI